MRELARIGRMLSLLGQVWYKNQDMRLGQLVYNLCRPSEDVFYVEDNIIEERLKEVAKNGW